MLFKTVSTDSDLYFERFSSLCPAWLQMYPALKTALVELHTMVGVQVDPNRAEEKFFINVFQRLPILLKEEKIPFFRLPGYISDLCLTLGRQEKCSEALVKLRNQCNAVHRLIQESEANFRSGSKRI